MKWEKKEGNKVQYWSVDKTGFTAGSHYGSGHTDNAIHYAIEKLLDPLQMHYCQDYLPPNISYKDLLNCLILAIMEDNKHADCPAEMALIPTIEAFIADLPAMIQKGEELAKKAMKDYQVDKKKETINAQVQPIARPIPQRPQEGILLTAIEEYEHLWNSKIEQEKTTANRANVIEELKYQKLLFVELILGISQKENPNLCLWHYRRLSIIKTKARIQRIILEQKIQNYQNPKQERLWNDIIKEQGEFVLEKWEWAFQIWEHGSRFSLDSNVYLEKVALLLNGYAKLISTCLKEEAYESFEDYWNTIVGSKLLDIALQNFYNNQFDERKECHQFIDIDDLSVARLQDLEHSFEIDEISAIDFQQLLLAMLKTKGGKPSNLELYSLSKEAVIKVSFSNFYNQPTGKIDQALNFYERLIPEQEAQDFQFYWIKTDFNIGYDEQANPLFGADINSACIVAYSNKKQHILLVNGSD